MSSYSDFAANISRILENEGNQISAAQIARGQALAQGIQGAAQSVAAIPGQMQQQKQQQAELQTRGLQNQVLGAELTQMQQAQAAQFQANKVIATMPRNPDGTYDTGTVMQGLAAKNVPLDQQERLATSLDNVNKVMKSFNESKVNHAADLADSILRSHQPNEPVTPEAVHLGLAAAKAMNLATDQDVAQFTNALGQGADPRAVLQDIRSLSDKYKEKPMLLPPTPAGAAPAQIVDPMSRQVIASGGIPGPKAPTNDIEAAIGAVAKDPTHPTQDEYAKALAMVKTATDTAGKDTARAEDIRTRLTLGRPVSPADQAWLDSHVAEKLVGPEAAAAAAADRQAQTIQQQTAQQGRAQTFAEQQAGRKEYTEKVATPYQTALASSQTLRDTVASAQAGNKIAANLQNLETAMSAIRAQGLNRINTTEIGVAASAGNLWDRIQGRLGSLTAGQAIPPDLQKDMLQFADILDKSATLKYQKGRQSLTQTYKGINLPDESVTAPSSTSGPRILSITPVR